MKYDYNFKITMELMTKMIVVDRVLARLIGARPYLYSEMCCYKGHLSRHTLNFK